MSAISEFWLKRGNGEFILEEVSSLPLKVFKQRQDGCSVDASGPSDVNVLLFAGLCQLGPPPAQSTPLPAAGIGWEGQAETPDRQTFLPTSLGTLRRPKSPNQA